MRQMSYSMCRFWAYDESKKILGAGKDAPAWKLAAAGSMGAYSYSRTIIQGCSHLICPLAGGIAGLVGNPGGRLLSTCQEIW
jgi:dicarboxylate transporter 10